MTTQKDETSIALMAKDIQYMRGDIGEIKASVKALDGIYATKTYIDDALRALAVQINLLQKELIEVRRSNNLWKWLAPTLTGLVVAVLTSIMTFLIISYLQNLK